MARLARADVFAPDEVAVVHVMNRGNDHGDRASLVFDEDRADELAWEPG